MQLFVIMRDFFKCVFLYTSSFATCQILKEMFNTYRWSVFTFEHYCTQILYAVILDMMADEIYLQLPLNHDIYTTSKNVFPCKCTILYNMLYDACQHLYRTKVKGGSHWLGMQRKSEINTGKTLEWKRRDWHWYDGTTLDFVNWGELQPNNDKVMCAVVNRYTGLWDDRSCDTLHRYICKRGMYLILFPTYGL